MNTQKDRDYLKGAQKNIKGSVKTEESQTLTSSLVFLKVNNQESWHKNTNHFKDYLHWNNINFYCLLYPSVYLYVYMCVGVEGMRVVSGVWNKLACLCFFLSYFQFLSANSIWNLQNVECGVFTMCNSLYMAVHLKQWTVALTAETSVFRYNWLQVLS